MRPDARPDCARRTNLRAARSRLRATRVAPTPDPSYLDPRPGTSQVPFIFKRAIDTLTSGSTTAAVGWMVAYGMSRGVYTLLQVAALPD